jgi:hypothetical protein
MSENEYDDSLCMHTFKTYSKRNTEEEQRDTVVRSVFIQGHHPEQRSEQKAHNDRLLQRSCQPSVLR